MSRRSAFSLIEMLVATMLVAVLMGAVLMLLGGVNRDVRTVQAVDRQPQLEGVLDLLARDAANAESIRVADDRRSVVLAGNIGIERHTLAADGRLARVIYRISNDGQMRRQQSYLDDPARPLAWSELAAIDVYSISIGRTESSDARQRIVLGTRSGAVSRELMSP